MGEDSLLHLFFNCIYARVIWRNSFWPLDFASLNFIDMMDWIKLMLSPCSSLGVPQAKSHKFQIFAAMVCDLSWYHRNKAFHNEQSIDALLLSKKFNSVTLDHFTAWHQDI
jgi:hypothetical protein